MTIGVPARGGGRVAGSHRVIDTNRRTVGAACAATTHALTVATTVMVAKADAAKLKNKRRKAARTLLGSGQVSIRPRKHLVDGKLVSKLPFNANDDTDAAGSFHQYGNSYPKAAAVSPKM